jgi:N-acetylmuramoyl-L-alanine amidase
MLKRAAGYEKSPAKSAQFRAYNNYKNLYLKALLNDTAKLRIKALKGIVRTGHKLHIDVSQYEKELLETKPKKVHTVAHKSHKSYKKKKPKIKIKSSHKLKYIGWKNGNLQLVFDKKLRNNQINYFNRYDRKRKKYFYIFDIHASMLSKSQTLRKEGVDRIKLSQYTPNTLRLLIENSSPLNLHYSKRPFGIEVRIKSKKITKRDSVVKRKKTAPRRLDRDKIIVIDAGHGGKDPGAIGYKKYREKVVVLSIAKELRNILQARGYKVYMTRSRDHFVKLRNRTKYANKKEADIFISIHANAVSKKHANKTYGIECYYLSKSRSKRAKNVAAKENSADLADMNFYGKESFLNTLNSHNIIAANKLAIDLQRSALAELKNKYRYVKDAGVREGPFWVLVGAQMPAVLVEVGFITNPREAKRLINKKYQKTLAKGLANGVERYFLNCRKRR